MEGRGFGRHCLMVFVNSDADVGVVDRFLVGRVRVREAYWGGMAVCRLSTRGRRRMDRRGEDGMKDGLGPEGVGN